MIRDPRRSRNKTALTVFKLIYRIKEKVLSCINLILFPPIAIAIASPFLIGLLMTWAFAFEGAKSLFAPIAYVLSAVLLISFCSWLIKTTYSGHIRSALNKHPSIMRFTSDTEFKRQVGLMAGASVDVLWAFFNLIFAIIQSSTWLLTLGLYYLTFGCLRSRLYFLIKKGVSTEIACKESIRAGTALIVSIFVLSGIVVLAIKDGEAVSYGNIGIYAAASFSFYSLIGSIISFVKNQRCNSVIINTCCCVNVAISTISMIVLETAMFETFSTDKGETTALFLTISGFFAALLLLFLGAFTIAKAKRISQTTQ